MYVVFAPASKNDIHPNNEAGHDNGKKNNSDNPQRLNLEYMALQEEERQDTFYDNFVFKLKS